MTSQDSLFVLEWSRYRLNLEERTHIMGVLNVTPDSFSDGGLFFSHDKAIEHGLAIAGDGADIIDVGGESTRPYAEGTSELEEMDRVIPVIEALHKELNIPISIDTTKASVAREALKAGASIINDIGALRFDRAMVDVAAEGDVPLILMHMKGRPRTMQDSPTYSHLIPEIMDFLQAAVHQAIEGGVRRDLIIIDPGIGFGKTIDHNLEIIRDLSHFHSLNQPILFGCSRKAFIGHILGKEPRDRDTGTMAAVTAGVLNGAHIVRVHNVSMAVETIKVADALKRGRSITSHS
jgi:dihydropteroate synthase